MTQREFKTRSLICGILTATVFSVISYFVFDTNAFDIGSTGMFIFIVYYTGEFLYYAFMRLRYPDLVKRIFVDDMDERAQVISYKTSSTFVKFLVPISILTLVYVDIMGYQELRIGLSRVMLLILFLYVVIHIYYRRKN